ncbi:S-layer homology domain-containing protein [Vallitalea pronyensis]|uniref:S-layer homology domain-containing protein n=1 Tax=Vallitalea pronyensis TaxID=1348613 RepID=A0A8J8MGZ5_9FIRM|nr:S-layer homology domain-containing protein [Vallitalea pronyensis]QUI21286.1 S-layer homology domain-containing protein [Vallitalea pronyensis]
MKKFIITMFILVLCMNSVTLSHASMTIDDKANTLHDFNIIMGNGRDFNLEGTLTRAEAATFIVRLLGQEALVKKDAINYRNTGFLDVEMKQWYAPYIGYCVSQGIIDGFSDGNYKPKEPISERAFIKLTAEALGYKKDIDFSWSNLFVFAYKKGIVIDGSYLSKNNDNLNYKRKDVINVLYNILNKEIKDDGRTAIERLIDNKVINPSIAEKYGYIIDKNPTKIKQLNVQSKTRIEIEFNENIEEIKEKNISIISNNNDQKLDVSINKIEKNKLILDTSNQESKVTYTIQLIDIVDEDGFTKTIDDVKFVGYSIIAVESEYFHLSKIIPISKNQIQIYFTQPINAVATIENYYIIKQDGKPIINGNPSNMEIALNPTDNKSITMRLINHEFDLSMDYELVARSLLVDKKGAPINNRQNETMAFEPIYLENKKLEYVSATAVDKQTIEVQFNMPLDKQSAEEISNYIIKSPEGQIVPIIKAKLLGEYGGNIVQLGVPLPMSGNVNYPITVKNINDSLRQHSIYETDSYVYVMDVDHAELNADLVYPINDREIAIYFNQPIDESTATLQANYLISGVNDHSFNTINPVAIYFNEKENNSMVKIMLPVGVKYKDGFTYRVTLNQNIRNALFLSNTTSKDIEFKGLGFDGSKPIITQARMVTDDTIIVEYNTEIANMAPTSSAGNYTLSYSDGSTERTESPSSITIIDNKYVVMQFNDLSDSITYTIEANTIQDFSNVGYSVVGERTQVINYKE